MQFIQGDDAPLTYAHHVPEAALTRLGIPLGRTRDDRAVQCSIVGQALVRHDGGRARTSYSRSGEWWKLGRYEDTPFGRTRVLDTVDVLTDMGLLDGFRAKPGAHLAKEEKDRLQSAFWATESLVAAMQGEAIEHRRPRVPVLLRDEHGDPLPLPRTQKVDRTVRTMERRNEAIADICLTVDPKAVARGKWRFSDHHWWALSDKGEWTCVRSEPYPFMVQMFARRSFDLHGRMYGPWTGLPGVRRSELLLNGEPVCATEPDFRCLHLELAYAMCGARLDGDAYDVPGVTGIRRGQLKMAVNAYVNAPDRTATVRSLILKRFETGRDGRPAWPRRFTWSQTVEALERIEQRHEPIRAMFGSDAGVRLMRIDSEMAGRVMDACSKASVACLPVHDSFIVPGQHQGFVEGVMAEVLDRTRNKLSGSGSTTYPVARLHCARAEPGAPGAEALGPSSAEPETPGVVGILALPGEAPSVHQVSTRNLAPAPFKKEPLTYPDASTGNLAPAPSKEEPDTDPDVYTRNLAPTFSDLPWAFTGVSPDPHTSTGTADALACSAEPEPHTSSSSREPHTAASDTNLFRDPRISAIVVPDRPWASEPAMTDNRTAFATVPGPHVIYVDGCRVSGSPMYLLPLAEELLAQGLDPYTRPMAEPVLAPGLARADADYARARVVAGEASAYTRVTC